VVSKKNFDPTDVEAGREYVEAYVPLHPLCRAPVSGGSKPAHGHYAESEHADYVEHTH